VRGTDWEPIRILFDVDSYPLADEDDGMGSDNFDALRDNVLKDVELLLERTLYVQPRIDPIKTDATECNTLDIPSHLLASGAGVANVDFVLICKATKDLPDDWIVRAKTCVFDADHHDNPLIGSLEINMAKFDDVNLSD